MPFLSPPTLTKAEQETLVRVSSMHPRDHLIFSLALGTGLRLAEIVGLNVGDVFTADGQPRSRLRLRREIAIRRASKPDADNDRGSPEKGQEILDTTLALPSPAEDPR